MTSAVQLTATPAIRADGEQLQKFYRTSGWASTHPLSFFFFHTDNSWLLVCGCRWGCGRRRAFPRLAQQNGGSADGAKHRPHIHGQQAGRGTWCRPSVTLAAPAFFTPLMFLSCPDNRDAG
jgi:hypothetical protein